MMVHAENAPSAAPVRPRKELTLLSHHDGDLGHPPREELEALVNAEVEAKKAAWTERLYSGSAGLRLKVGATSEKELAPPPTLPSEGDGPIPRWKGRPTPKQLAAAEEATVRYAAIRKVQVEMDVVGAKSEAFAIEPTFFNVLYTHPSFGIMPVWGETGTLSEKNRLLPPINSRAGGTVTAEQRRAARVNWGNGRRAFPLNDQPPEYLAVSPSKHCAPSRPMIIAPKYDMPPMKGCIPQSLTTTNPWQRLPPHTSRTKALYEAMYGISPNDPRRQKKSHDQAATKLQASQRGYMARKAANSASGPSF